MSDAVLLLVGSDEVASLCEVNWHLTDRHRAANLVVRAADLDETKDVSPRSRYGQGGCGRCRPFDRSAPACGGVRTAHVLDDRERDLLAVRAGVRERKAGHVAVQHNLVIPAARKIAGDRPGHVGL